MIEVLVRQWMGVFIMAGTRDPQLLFSLTSEQKWGAGFATRDKQS